MWLCPKLNHKFLCLGAFPIIGRLSAIVGLEPSQGAFVNLFLRGRIIFNFWTTSLICSSFKSASLKFNSTPDVTLISFLLQL